MNQPIYWKDTILGTTSILLIVVWVGVIGCGNKHQLLNSEESKTSLVGTWRETITFAFGGTYTTTIAFTADKNYKFFGEGGPVAREGMRTLGTYSVDQNVITVVVTDTIEAGVTPGQSYASYFTISQAGRLTLSGTTHRSMLPSGVYERY